MSIWIRWSFARRAAFSARRNGVMIGISAALALRGCYRRRSWRPDMKFADRSDAGRRLAGKLMHLRERRPVILALPRGGVAIGFEIAQALSAPIDIMLVRKIGVPWQLELAVGAVSDGG